MKIDKDSDTLLKKYAKFDSNGLLLSIEVINQQIIEALDEEFISILHEEMVDRRDMYNSANPNEWFDKTCCYSIKKWQAETKEYIKNNPILQKNKVYEALANYTTKFWEYNIDNESENDLLNFERILREDRNEYFENIEDGTYGFKICPDFYFNLICGNYAVTAGDRSIICRAVKKEDELRFYREELNKEVIFKVEEVKGKEIEWIVNGECEYKAELDPLYKSMYSVYVKHPEGITDASLATNENLFILYRRIVVGETNKEKIDPKNVKDYISRLNKELFLNEVPKEYRISKEGNLRFIPYLKYKFNL